VLQKALVDELNRLLKGPSLYDTLRFAHMALTKKTRGLIEQDPQGKDLVYLNRLLLEEAYRGEITKTLYHPGITPESISVGFFLTGDESNVNITVREHDQNYYMDPINTKYKAGFNKFSWDTRIMDTLHIDWHALHATVEIKGKGQKIITPATLYDTPLLNLFKVEEYQFVFMPNVKGDVEYKIVYNQEVKAHGSLREQRAKQTTLIIWEPKDANKGIYQLQITFRFKPQFRSALEINTAYEFYHKTELGISD